MSWIDNVIESTEYQAWLRGQYEPDEHLFVGHVPTRPVPTWMLRGAGEDRPRLTDDQLAEREDEYLRKHGIE